MRPLRWVKASRRCGDDRGPSQSRRFYDRSACRRVASLDMSGTHSVDKLASEARTTPTRPDRDWLALGFKIVAAIVVVAFVAVLLKLAYSVVTGPDKGESVKAAWAFVAAVVATAVTLAG
jgi:hypothetical protein